MATSNTYEFGSNTEIDDLLKESFERIGIIGNEFTALQTQSAIMSANLELTSWQGKVPLAWTRKRFLNNIYIGQATYQLPKNITRIVDVCTTQPMRLNTGGTAFSSSGGSAANCFDPNITSGCTQTSSNGYISYDYGQNNQQSIQFVGITPLSAQSDYTISVDYSFDNVNWFEVYKSSKQTYYANQIQWLVISKSLSARAWRIRETGGAVLSIQQLYFSVPNTLGAPDRYIMPMSYTEWMQIPVKNSVGYTSRYFHDEQIQPTITLWPILGPQFSPSNYTAFLYTAYQYIQDVTNLFDQFDIPQRFYEALVAGITARLAFKFAPEKAALFKQEANEAFEIATLTEFQSVTLRFQPDFTSYK